MFLHVFVCLTVCQQDYSKTRAWIWMKCCVSTDVGTWTNLLTFEPDQDRTDAGTGLFSPISYKRCNAEFYVGKIPRTRIGSVIFGASSGFKMVLFTEPSDKLCRRYTHSTECPSSQQQQQQQQQQQYGLVSVFKFSLGIISGRIFPGRGLSH